MYIVSTNYNLEVRVYRYNELQAQTLGLSYRVRLLPLLVKSTADRMSLTPHHTHTRRHTPLFCRRHPFSTLVSGVSSAFWVCASWLCHRPKLEPDKLAKAQLNLAYITSGVREEIRMSAQSEVENFSNPSRYQDYLTVSQRAVDGCSGSTSNDKSSSLIVVGVVVN